MPFPNAYRPTKTLAQPTETGTATIQNRSNKDLEFLWYNTNVITTRDIGIAIGEFISNIPFRINIQIRFLLAVMSIDSYAKALDYPSILTMYGAEVMYGDLTKPRPTDSLRTEIYGIEFQSTKYNEPVVPDESIRYNYVELVGKLSPSTTYRINVIENPTDLGGIDPFGPSPRSIEKLVAQDTLTTPSVTAIQNPLIKSPFFDRTYRMDIIVSQATSGNRRRLIVNMQTDMAGRGIDYYIEDADVNFRANEGAIRATVNTNGVAARWNIVRTITRTRTRDADWTPISLNNQNAEINRLGGGFILWLRRTSTQAGAFMAVFFIVGITTSDARRIYFRSGNVVRSFVIDPINASAT